MTHQSKQLQPFLAAGFLPAPPPPSLPLPTPPSLSAALVEFQGALACGILLFPESLICSLTPISGAALFHIH